MNHPFQKPKANFLKTNSSTITNVIFLLFLSLSLTALMVLYIDHLPSNIREGMPATGDIIAAQRYEWEDEEATERSREEATKDVLSVFDHNQNLTAERVLIIQQSFKQARAQLFSTDEEGEVVSNKLSSDDEKKLRESFQIGLGIVLKDSEYKTIRGEDFSEEFEKALIGLLEPLQKKLIVEDKGELLARVERGFVLRKLSGTELVSDQVIKDTEIFLSREEAQDFYKKSKVATLQKDLYLDFIDLGKIKTALKVLPQFLKANVTYNQYESEAVLERARQSVRPVKRVREKGEIIIRRGEKYEAWHIRVIDGIRKARLETNIILKFLGLFGIVLTSMMVIIYFAKREIFGFKPTRKDFYFLGVTLVGFMSMLRLGTFVATNLHDAVNLGSGLNTFYYLFPVAAGAMMVRYILNAETSFVFAVVMGLFAGVFLDNNMEITFYYLVSGVFAAHLIGRAERRATVFRFSVYVGLLQMLLVGCFYLMSNVGTGASLDIQALSVNCLFAFFGGVANAIVMLALSPIVETIFGYTTNFQLLELANMNHPLLREMIVRAPGTYHHSQLVGILAEAGARAVDANPLLAKVGSFYHDIGKMKKPQYFIENQKGYNPHDTLAPSMSALIIDAHVKDGLDMAEEYKLPKIITDFIPEHQGTKLIGYFYNKAKTQAEEAGSGEIDEKDYRYRGPKPQSRESGIVMLADTIEAAVRSMPDKAPQKISGLVKRLVNYHFTDGQLDECQLTLKDLNLIVDAFVKILIGIYHQRVEYPESGESTPMQIVKSDEENEEADSDPDSESPSKAASISPIFKEKGR